MIEFTANLVIDFEIKEKFLMELEVAYVINPERAGGTSINRVHGDIIMIKMWFSKIFGSKLLLNFQIKALIV